MRKRPSLKKYPTGGTTPVAPAPKKQYSMDEYNKLLGNYQTINPTDPQSGKDVKDYVGNYITPNIKNYQTQLNTALRSKYKLDANAPITNQYLSPEEADKALNGKYSDYMTNFDAYQNYRSKTPQMPERTVQGTETVDPKVYGRRHVNLFQPYKVNTETPTFAMGGKKLPKFANGDVFGQGQNYLGDDANSGNYNPADPNREVSNNSTPNYMGYAQGAMGAMAAYQGTQNNPNLTDEQKTSQGLNSGVDAAASSATPWYGYAKKAEGLGKNFIKKDANGNPVNGTNKAANEIMTPDHEQMLNDISNKNYGLALLDSTGLGKFGRMASELTGNSNKTSGGWGRINRLIGTPQYNKSGDNTNTDANRFPFGGNNMIPNGEVEKQEVIQSPNGSTGQVDGPDHAHGGVPVNMPNGAHIFSDRLKLPGSKETIADEAARFLTKKEEKVLGDDKATNIAKATAKLTAHVKKQKLDQLFQAQETLKQAKVQRYAERMGVQLGALEGSQQDAASDQGQQDYPEMANGGIHIKPSHRGRFTAYKERTGQTTEQALHSSNPHVRQMANFARNASKWHHAYGGVHQYPGGGEYSFMDQVNADNAAKPSYGYPYTQDDINAQNARLSDLANFTINNQNSKSSVGFANSQARDYVNNNPSSGPDADAVSPFDPTKVPSNSPQAGNKGGGPDWRNIAEGVGNNLGQNAGNIWDLYKSGFGKKYNKENYGNVNPTLLDPTQALTDADIQNQQTRAGIKGAVNGNAGAYLSNTIQAGAQNTLNKARIRQDYQNKNAEIENYSKYYNKGNEIAAKTATEQNKARSEDMAAHAIRDIGSKSADAYKDYKDNEMDTKKMNIINQYFPNYKFDKNTFDMYYQAATTGNTKSKPKYRRSKATPGIIEG